MDARTDREIRKLFDDYLRMYASRDDGLTALFSEDFSGFTGGGDFLVKDRDAWIAITRQDFAQVTEPIRIERKDLAVQSLADTIAVATGFFVIHLPIKDHVLSRETARLVLIFRKESAGWRITHSSISIPYSLVGDGEVYPLKQLADRTQVLEELVVERTAALQQSESRYRSILTASPDDITITDAAGRIVMVSPVAFSLFGYAREADFVGRPVTDFIAPEDRARAMSQVALKRQGAVTGPSEYRGLRLDGTTFDIEVNSEFMRDAEGSPTGMVVIVRDITERKQAEVEREKLEVLNRQLQKADSLGRMAAAIAHHFNNQLQAVMMSLELVGNAAPRDADTADSLAIAMNATRKAAEVSTLMLTYLGQSPGARTVLDLTDTCLPAVALLRAFLPKHVGLDTALPSPGPLVAADANQIQQMLTNLVTNAWEASGEGQGTIRVTVKPVAAADIALAHRFPIDWQPGDVTYACLEVADAGSGIAADEVERLFDPFFSSKFTGRGLGLPVVLGITRSHAGAITVESALGRGSVFRVFLPLAADRVS